MKNLDEYLFEIQESKFNIYLNKFDKSYYNSLPESDRKKIIFDENSPFFTIIYENKKAGICGVIKNMFFQIIIEVKFRGQNIVEKASDMIMKELDLKQLFATIDVENIPSYKAHLKAGFKEFSKSQIDILRKLGKLKNNQTLLVKIVKNSYTWPIIIFPKSEWANTKRNLNSGKEISTTRNSCGKNIKIFKPNQIYKTEWGVQIIITKVQHFDDPLKIPTYSKMNKIMKNSIDHGIKMCGTDNLQWNHLIKFKK